MFFPLVCVYVYILFVVLSELIYGLLSTSFLSRISMYFSVSDCLCVGFCPLCSMSLCPYVYVRLCCYGHTACCFCVWLTCCCCCCFCCCCYLLQDDILDMQLQRNLDYLDQQVCLTQHSQYRMSQLLLQHCCEHWHCYKLKCTNVEDNMVWIFYTAIHPVSLKLPHSLSYHIVSTTLSLYVTARLSIQKGKVYPMRNKSKYISSDSRAEILWESVLALCQQYSVETAITGNILEILTTFILLEENINCWYLIFCRKLELNILSDNIKVKLFSLLIMCLFTIKQ